MTRGTLFWPPSLPRAFIHAAKLPGGRKIACRCAHAVPAGTVLRVIDVASDSSRSTRARIRRLARIHGTEIRQIEMMAGAILGKDRSTVKSATRTADGCRPRAHRRVDFLADEMLAESR